MFELKFRKQILVELFGFTVLFISISAGAAHAQVCKGTILKDRLVSALKSKSQSSQQLANYINQCGVNFQLTPDVEAELVSAGARPVVIEAVRNNYHQETVAVNPPKKSGGAGGNSTNSNSPVTKDKLVKALRTKALSNGAILDVVEKNGVDFETTSSVEKELSAAGASPAIITAVKNAYRGDRAVVETTTTAKSGSGANRFQSLVDGAMDSYNRDVNANLPAGSAGRLQAIQMLTEAAALQPNNPVAFQQLGFMTLYGTNNGFAAAEANFKKAVELGGSAVFRVYHDHNGTFSDTCNGSLYISKNAVRFESDDNKHTFDVKDEDIKNVKTNNSFIKAFQLKPGSYKIVLKNGDGSKNFNFAPLTANNEESKIVIRLIGK